VSLVDGLEALGVLDLVLLSVLAFFAGAGDLLDLLAPLLAERDVERFLDEA